MKISGFTFVRNACKLYYPVKAAITSILPIVDEFIVALGDNHPDDRTEEDILSIQSPKIKIVRTMWNPEQFPRGMEYARQTDIAKGACTGDWLFYIQCDEVLHEKYHPIVTAACKEFLEHHDIEGLLFQYKHFWGDYSHYLESHAWYPNEIRIIRNRPDIHSWRDAQSFRKIPNFDGKNYYRKKGTEKLNVVAINACMHHYGFVRPPVVMQQKSKNHSRIYRGESATAKRFENTAEQFDYGNISRLTVYRDSHPHVMKDWIARMDWQTVLKRRPRPHARVVHKHDKPKYRFITFIEQKLLGGRQLFGFRNYHLIGKKSFPANILG